MPPNPTPADVVALIRSRPERAKFIYHSLFSTSSFFVPSLHFRANGIFNMPESTESLAAIDASIIDQNSSSALVRAVARGEADLAAVWDGTRARFVDGATDSMDAALGRTLAFVRLQSAIPNDFLVCSRWAPPEHKERLREAIRNMAADEIGIGDFSTWLDIADASQARAALADLRWQAREQAAPVTVDVRAAGGTAGAAEMVEAAKHAVRLSGTEFVLFDEDYHEHIDFVWTLDVIHDGAARLRSSIPGAGVDDQIFPISFLDFEDLTRRIVGLMQGGSTASAMSGRTVAGSRSSSAIRPWRYRPNSEVPVQRVTWLDQKRNSFRAGPVFPVRVQDSSLYTHGFDTEDFRINAGTDIDLDPMSNVSYRVYQLRIIPSSRIFQLATGALVALLALAALAAVLTLRRRTTRLFEV